AFDRADNDLTDRLDARLSQQRAQDLHATFHGVGSEQHFGHEQDAVAEVDADDAHPFDERVVQDLLSVPAALEEYAGRVFDLALQAVVQIVVDLLDELLVTQVV